MLFHVDSDDLDRAVAIIREKTGMPTVFFAAECISCYRKGLKVQSPKLTYRATVVRPSLHMVEIGDSINDAIEKIIERCRLLEKSLNEFVS